MEKETSENLEQLLRVRKEYHSKAFRFLAQSALIFGVPAFLAYVLGTNLDRTYGTGKRYILILLVVAFIVSWTVVIALSRKIDRGLRDTEAKIKKVKKGRTSGGLWKPIAAEEEGAASDVVYNKPETWRSPNKK